MSPERKERPILFSGPLVRAILDGTKTETRRPITRPFPYGKPGDRLWVRETHWIGKEPPTPEVAYRATDGEFPPHMKGERWRPPIFMPRWASRITLEVTEVRAERVQEITEEGALAEGCIGRECDCRYAEFGACADCMNTGYVEPPSLHFRHLWDDIYEGRKDKPGLDWASNPWVWVVKFRRVSP